ncbi:hypothetical protein M408DRAFT_138151 [Serendipita vermifera MAFF 305830]|uniref:Zinc finger PHD-type domain-containing protein n=1 Tax=Serendipita vermifera MAFF 305830 TaxID=933852 RepID=A0A0C3AK35_SERVB|nr:hypothetical protein M408DRAFT_138151 [Serendipita vermifera MAFF 305830]
MSAQGQNGSYQSAQRNESTARGVNGDTPNKRRRVQGSNISSNIHHPSQLQGPRADRDMDTDDYSTPRRGVSALDAEAYRPGGNTGNRARTQGRKGRDGRPTGQNPTLDSNGVPIPMDVVTQPRSNGDMGPNRLLGTVSQGPESTVAAHGHPNGASSSKNQSQNGRSKGSSSQHRSNPNPQPQQYPMHYQPYGGRSHISGNPFVDPSAGPYEMAANAYATTGNMNPLMDFHHHGAMNMNPNLNHLPTNANYPNAIGIGMVIPTSLPPPPGTAHGRPSSASMSGRNTYDTQPPRSAGSSRQSGFDANAPIPSSSHTISTSKSGSSRIADTSVGRETPQEFNVAANGSSASGGLMPLPMLTSLPPAAVMTHSAHAPRSSYTDATAARNRGYSVTQGYSSSFNATDEANTISTSASHHSHAVYQPPHPSTLASHSGYTSNPTSNAINVEKGSAKSDVHPSLLSSVSSREPLSSSLHARASSASTAGPMMPGITHSNLARDPPLRDDPVIPAERVEREIKTNPPSRARSGTIDGNTPAGTPVGTLPKFREDSMEQRAGPVYERASPPVEQRDIVSSSSRVPRPSSGTAPNSGGPTPTGFSLPPLPQIPVQTTFPGERADAGDKFGSGEREGVSNVTNVKRPVVQDRPLSERELEQERRSVDDDNHDTTGARGDLGPPSRDGQEKVIRTPARRKAGEEGSFPSDTPFKFGEGSELAEGQTADEDSKPYCICGRPSFGQMIGCDDSECEFEWVSVLSAIRCNKLFMSFSSIYSA